MTYEKNLLSKSFNRLPEQGRTLFTLLTVLRIDEWLGFGDHGRECIALVSEFCPYGRIVADHLELCCAAEGPPMPYVLPTRIILTDDYDLYAGGLRFLDYR
jgi:hypothetical protein